MFSSGYRFRVGDIVYLPASLTFVEVWWRGQLLGPIGQRYRVNVYWLGAPHWNCYYEDEVLGVC